MSTSHEMQIRVRYSETDAMGFLHHANYLTYFEMGRTELFRSQGGDYRALEERGVFMVVTRATCNYLLPARYDDLLTLKTKIAKVGQAKLEHDYALFRAGQLLATGHTVLACVDRQGRVQRVTDVLGDQL
jgi:acyl-CoA thioester hydrolase